MERKIKIMTVFGTRPEAIKMAPVINEIKKREEFECVVCVTGQHREMLDSVLRCFDIFADVDLDIMKQGQSLSHITSRILDGIEPVLLSLRPELVLVHGDTSTAFASALACFYLRIPIGHVESGLRTYDMRSPFPEEWNRQAISRLSDIHFAPTRAAYQNLLREGVGERSIAITGNTAIDAIRSTVRKDWTHPLLDWARGGRLCLMTAHRRESLGGAMANIFRSVRRIADEFEDVRIVYPVHPNPTLGALAERELGGHERIRLIPPMDTLDFHNLMARAYMVITDSGGVQEEAPSLGIPTLVMRDITERPEGIFSYSARLIGTSEGSVYRGIRDLLEEPARHAAMSGARDIYGDGCASERIVDFITDFFDLR